METMEGEEGCGWFLLATREGNRVGRAKRETEKRGEKEEVSQISICIEDEGGGRGGERNKEDPLLEATHCGRGRGDGKRSCQNLVLQSGRVDVMASHSPPCPQTTLESAIDEDTPPPPPPLLALESRKEAAAAAAIGRPRRRSRLSKRPPPPFWSLRAAIFFIK